MYFSFHYKNAFFYYIKRNFINFPVSTMFHYHYYEYLTFLVFITRKSRQKNNILKETITIK